MKNFLINNFFPNPVGEISWWEVKDSSPPEVNGATNRGTIVRKASETIPSGKTSKDRKKPPPVLKKYLFLTLEPPRRYYFKGD